MANVVEIVIKATDQATAQIRQVEGSLGKMQGILSALGGPGGIATAIGAGLTAMVMGAKSFGDEIERLQRVSKATGVELNSLRVLETVARQGGLSSTELTMAIARLNRAIGVQDEMLKKLGITTRDPIEALMQLAQMMASAHDQANKNAVAMRLLGRGGSELIGVLEQLPEKYAQISAELRKLTPEQIALGERMDNAADRWDTMWTNMVTRAKIGAANLMETVAPPGSALANFLFGTPMTGGPVLSAHQNPVAPRAPAPGTSPIDNLGGGGGGQSLTEWASGMTQYYGLTTPEPRNVLRAHPVLKFDAKLVEIGKKLQYLQIVAEGVAYGIANAFSVAFSMIGQKGATLGRVLASAFQAMAQTILQALAQIAASKILLWIAGLMPGAGILGAIGKVIGGVGKVLGGANQTTGNTYVINAMDARDVVMQLQSPYGGMRTARDRVAVGAGY